MDCVGINGLRLSNGLLWSSSEVLIPSNLFGLSSLGNEIHKLDLLVYCKRTGVSGRAPWYGLAVGPQTR